MSRGFWTRLCFRCIGSEKHYMLVSRPVSSQRYIFSSSLRLARSNATRSPAFKTPHYQGFDSLVFQGRSELKTHLFDVWRPLLECTISRLPASRRASPPVPNCVLSVSEFMAVCSGSGVAGARQNIVAKARKDCGEVLSGL
jgi:hypothetical protein